MTNVRRDLSDEVESILSDIRQLAQKFLKMLDAKEVDISTNIASEWRATVGGGVRTEENGSLAGD